VAAPSPLSSALLAGRFGAARASPSRPRADAPEPAPPAAAAADSAQPDEPAAAPARVVPAPLPAADPATRVPRPAAIRGIYLNAWAAGSSRKLERLIGIANATEVNAFVIAVTEAGEPSYRSAVPLPHEI